MAISLHAVTWASLGTFFFGLSYTLFYMYLFICSSKNSNISHQDNFCVSFSTVHELLAEKSLYTGPAYQSWNSFYIEDSFYAFIYIQILILGKQIKNNLLPSALNWKCLCKPLESISFDNQNNLSLSKNHHLQQEQGWSLRGREWRGQLHLQRKSLSVQGQVPLYPSHESSIDPNIITRPRWWPDIGTAVSELEASNPLTQLRQRLKG